MNVFDKDKILLLWTPQMGLVVRQDGVLKYISKGVDASQELVDGEYEWRENHLYQPTASLQPRLVGGIAPGSKVAAANLNGEGRCFTHPAISFDADEAWSVSYILNVNNIENSFIKLIPTGTNGIWFQSEGLSIRFYTNISGTDYYGSYFSYTANFGKHILITVTYVDSTLKVYVNGFEKSSNSITFPSFLFNGISNNFSYKWIGTISYYRIQSGALTPTQVTAEYNLLRSMYPEIESIDIGTQTWATRNFEAVATPLGNVIANVTENGAVEKVTQPFTFAGWNIYSGSLIDANTINGAAINYFIPPSNNWVKVRIVGSGEGFFSDPAPTYLNSINLTGVFDVTAYRKFSTPYPIFNVNSGNLTITTLSIQELNWSNATEIYDAVYAATIGDAATKEYAALKEAAMWRYPNNSIDKGAWGGKLYNKYAMMLLSLDMASANFGYHIPTNAEVVELLAQVGGDTNKLKYVGLDYWNDAIGTNESGLTLLGTGVITPGGVYTGEKELTGFWTSDSNEFPTSGLPIRIVKNV